MPLAPHVDGIERLRVRMIKVADGPLGIVAQEQVQVLYAQPLALRCQGGKDAGNKVVEILESESPGDEIAKKALGDPLGPFGCNPSPVSLISLNQFVGHELLDYKFEVFIVNRTVMGLNDLLYRFGKTPEDVHVL